MNPDGTVSWRELLADARQRFRTAEVAEPERSARLIVEDLAGESGPAAVLALDDLVTERGMAAFDDRVGRRLAGEPIQYVLGHWAFRTLDLFIDDRVLIPRPETEVVAGLAIDHARGLVAAGHTAPAVDLGTGSGAIGLSLAVEVRALEVWITDVAPGALAVARANVAGLGRDGSRIVAVAGEWFDALPDDRRRTFGVVVSNPPYIADDEEVDPSVVDWEPSGALRAGPTGSEHLDHLVDAAPDWLIDEGALVLEMAPWQTASIAERAETHFREVEVVADLAGADRAVVARRPLR